MSPCGKMDQVRTQICVILQLKLLNLREFPVEHDGFGCLGGTTVDGYNRIAFPNSVNGIGGLQCT